MRELQRATAGATLDMALTETGSTHMATAERTVVVINRPTRGAERTRRVTFRTIDPFMRSHRVTCVWRGWTRLCRSRRKGHADALITAVGADGIIRVAVCADDEGDRPGLFMPYVNLGGVHSHPSNYSAWLAHGGAASTRHDVRDDVQLPVGDAIKKSGIPREKIFLTTKVPCCPEGGLGTKWCKW